MSKPKSPLHSRSRSYSRRRVNQYPIRQRFLIVCEGEKTEPNYFRKFRAPGLIVEVKGTGCNTVSVVREAIQLSQEEPYDQVMKSCAGSAASQAILRSG